MDAGDGPGLRSRAQLLALAGFLTELERSGATADDPVFAALHERLHADGWIAPFDWNAWVTTPEAVALRDDPEALGRASAEQLRRLLTAIWRQDRFCEGTIAEAFASGLLARVLRRARALAEA